ncbi:MAG: LysM peptidoglycan-binding domain-containing protein, partial [Spirochaetaceae bacterium]
MAANGEPGTGRKTLVRINIALAVFDLLLLAALVYLFIYPGEAQELLLPADEPPAERAAEPSAEEPADAEPETDSATPDSEAPEETAEPEEPSEPEEPAIDPAAREPVSQHRVERGDTFYDIAGIYWENEHLWPDLYALNRDDFRDPDFIRPGEQVDIYRSLAADGELSAEDR